MKNLNLNGFGVLEMNAKEMRETDGGFIPLIIAAVALVVSSCTIVHNTGDNVTINAGTSADSTGNGNSAGQGSGNKVR
jgi:hypothetical protein